MEEIKRILAVSRMTRGCRKVVHSGISLAQKYGAELAVIHVIYNPFSKGWNLPLKFFEEEYRKDMERARGEMAGIIDREKKAGLAIREFVTEGEPTAEILKVIEREKIDLVILLAHEESRLEHFFFGRGNEGIIRRMPCSVLLVKN